MLTIPYLPIGRPTPETIQHVLTQGIVVCNARLGKYQVSQMQRIIFRLDLTCKFKCTEGACAGRIRRGVSLLVYWSL